MKKHFINLRVAWRSLLKATSRNHDPLLVQSMASFNFGGGWSELRLKISSKHMSAESTINEEFAV